jgi:hypothetical protein
MKKLVIVFLIFIGFNVELLKSQQYYPFQADTAKWSVQSSQGAWPPPTIYSTYQYFINGDTLIDTVLYSAIYSAETYLSEDIDTANAIYLGGLREDTNKYIYYKPGELDQVMSYQAYIDNSTLDELLLYRFDLDSGEIFYLNQYQNFPYIVEDIDSVLVDTKYRKRYILSGGNPDFDEWIEGIGSYFSLFGPLCHNFEGYDFLLCYEDPAIFYLGEWNNMGKCYYTVGIPEKYNPSFDMYPNPADENIKITLEESADADQLVLYNSTGQIVNHLKIEAINQKYEMEVSSLPSGLYVVVLFSEGRMVDKRKFVISH